MNETWDYIRCVSTLTGEIGLLKRIFDAQDSARKAAMNREWAGFDGKLAELNLLGEELTLLENERERLFAALAADGGGGAKERPFYALIAGLPREERQELERLYVELKIATLKLRALSEAFFSYLNEVRAMAAAYIEAVCPGRSGKLYTRKGSKVSQDLRSMILNDRF